MIRPTNIYHCNGRERPSGKPLVVQDGWYEFMEGGQPVRRQKWKLVQTEPAPECKPGSFKDKGCSGCAHRNPTTRS